MKKTYNYNETINQFKDSDSGKFGKAFEINVKHYLNGNKGNANKVSAKGKTDVTSKGIKYEVKSNCGEINGDIFKNDYIIYTYDSENTFATPEQARVIPAGEFVEIVKNCGLLRTKKSTNGQLKTTIQSYKNSKRKASTWASIIDSYPTLEQFIG